MQLVQIGEEIASRTLQWTDSSGLIRNVRIRIGRPQPFPDSTDTYCPVQIVGIGSETVRYSAGIDGIQAIVLALKMVRAELEALERELSGQFTWCGQSSLDMD